MCLGGVGKTTFAVTLAHGLAFTGQHTLLVDLDPQRHVAFALGIDKASGLYRLVVDEETVTIKLARDHIFQPHLIIQKEDETFYREVESGEKLDRASLAQKWQNCSSGLIKTRH